MHQPAAPDVAPPSQVAEMLRRLGEEFAFPDPRQASAEGLLAYGGDLRPERLLVAYAQGVFPWYESDPILWFSPDPRTVLQPHAIHVGRSLRRTLRRAPFELRLDTAFGQVIRSCAAAPRAGQAGTWITPDMVEAYTHLHELGFAHSVESWREGELVGGLYGVSLGAAFFGESMFAARSDASKVAFVFLVAQLREWGFQLVDCQLHNDHVARFGAQEWPRERFLEALARALEQPTRIGPWRLDPGSSPELVSK